MPSKRKKNKRRMRRVQAQRRLLEEQHATSLPVKATPSIAVGAPGTVTKEVAKTPKPAPPKVPEAVPIAAPIVETPKVIPKTESPKEPVAKPAPEKVETPEPEPEDVVLEQTPVEVDIPVPAPVIEEAPVIETPLVEPAKVELAFVQEDAPIIAAAKPVTEITLPAEVPVAAPVETQVVLDKTSVQTTETQFTSEPLFKVVLEDTRVETTETEQIHEVYEPETEVEAENTAFPEEQTVADTEAVEAVTEIKAEPQTVEEAGVEELTVDVAEAEVKADVEAVCPLSREAEAVEDKAVEEKVVEEKVTEAAADEVKVECNEGGAVEAEFVVEAQATQELVTETVVECVKECATPQSDPDPVAEEEESCSPEEEEKTEVEVLSEEKTPAETDITAEDVPAQIEKLPVVQDTLPEAPLDEALAPVPQVKEVPLDTADVMVDDFVVTDSLTVAVCKIFRPGTSMVTSEEPEPAIAAEKTLIDVAAEKCLDVEESKSEKCEMPCPMQLSVESVQLTSVETSVEAALNGHFVPELSIES